MDLETFIASVRCRKTIWDKKTPHHHNRYTLDLLWTEVSEENDCTVKEAQCRWKSLRDYYRKEFQKAQYSADEEGKMIYKTSWPYFKLLHFLRGQFTLKPSIFKKLKTRDGLILKTCEDSTQSAVKEEQIYDLNRSLQSDTEEEAISYTVDYNEKEKIAKRNTINKNQTLFNLKRQNLSILGGKKTKKEERNKLDEDEQFFESLLPHVRTIKGVNKMHFRNEVQSLIIKYGYLSSRQNSIVGKSSVILHSDSAANVSQDWFQEQHRNDNL